MKDLDVIVDGKACKFAPCTIGKLDTVDNIFLFMRGRQYGMYPISNKHDAVASLKDAIADAIDYGYSGIVFTAAEPEDKSMTQDENGDFNF